MRPTNKIRIRDNQYLATIFLSFPNSKYKFISFRHAKKHKKSWLRWFAGKKIKWIDFRDFTQF